MWIEPIAPESATIIARRLSSREGLVWLDAQHDPSREGRYSFVGCDPTETILVPYGDASPFAALDRPEATNGSESGELQASAIPEWIGYCAYDATWSSPVRGAPQFERAEQPVVWFGRYDAVVAIDHQDGRTWVVGDNQAACQQLKGRLRAQPLPLHGWASGELQVDDTARHRTAIIRALGHIAAGDIYQVNLARRWSVDFEGQALRLWLAMREASQVPLGLFLDAGDHAVLACTMERFLYWDREHGRLVTRPIKGTLRRTEDGLSSEGSAKEQERLRADPKEQAEHVMIVDLMRNDLGRVAETGTVHVEEPLVVEPFTGLYHLVSTVSCQTRRDVTVRSILEATFPPGSVTGAPKIRAIELIEELEQHPREVYCGCVGFIDRAGGCSFAVAIRTAVIRDGHARYWAGGGLVAASDPDKEVAETELKAQVFLNATSALRR